MIRPLYHLFKNYFTKRNARIRKEALESMAIIRDIDECMREQERIFDLKNKTHP